MYILTRYVIWEVLKIFLAALAALTLVVTFGMGVQEGFKQGLPGTVMLFTMPFILPQVLGITIPASMLFSVCSVFGRMTGANEVVALKSLGISPMAVVWPAIVLASFLSLGTVCMYEVAATQCKPTIQRIVAESVEDIAYSMLQRNHSYDCDQLTITVRDVINPKKRGESQKLIDPTITIKGSSKIILRSAEAELHADLKAHVLRIVCRRNNVDIQQQGTSKIGMKFPGTEEYSVPIVVPPPDRYHQDWVATRNVPALVAELEAGVRHLERLREANRALGNPPSPKDADKITEQRQRIYRLRAESYRRWANGFTCLCFALLGTPVAMLWRHADVLTNFFVCFLPILAIYYPLLMLSQGLSTSGVAPPISFWTANVLISIPAVLLLRRIVQH
ncbi:MAG: LptF/LptG family permease [Thermoguttaceae bacterium]